MEDIHENILGVIKLTSPCKMVLQAASFSLNLPHLPEFFSFTLALNSFLGLVALCEAHKSRLFVTVCVRVCACVCVRVRVCACVRVRVPGCACVWVRECV